MVSPIYLSFSLSRAEVASSKMRIGASLSKALAIAILCLSPAENLLPSSSTLVSNLSGSDIIRS